MGTVRIWQRLKRLGRLLKRAVVEYGSGASLLAPLEHLRYAGCLYWGLIVIGILGWIVLFYMLNSYSG